MTSGEWHSGHHTVDGSRRYWREWRPAAGRYLPVLALHGSLTQSGMWKAPAEAAGAIPMLCPDQRGFGLSDDPGADACAAFAADALSLAAERLPGRFVVMGHSFACAIALEVARQASGRIAGVVLVDPVVRIPGAQPPSQPPAPAPAQPAAPVPESFATREDAERHFRDTEEGLWPDAALRQFVTDIMMRDGDRKGDSGPWRFPYTAARLRRLRSFTASAGSDFGLFAKAKAVTGPVLAFRGGMSKRFAAAAEPAFVSAFASPPEMVLCPDSGHFPSTTEPALFIAALERFLAPLR